MGQCGVLCAWKVLVLFSPRYDERDLIRGGGVPTPPRAYFYGYYFPAEVRRRARERGSRIFGSRLSSPLLHPSSCFMARLYFPQKTSKSKRIRNSPLVLLAENPAGGKVERRSSCCLSSRADLTISGPPPRSLLVCLCPRGAWRPGGPPRCSEHGLTLLRAPGWLPSCQFS